MRRIVIASLLSLPLVACNGSNVAGNKPAGTITQANSQQVAAGITTTVTGGANSSPTTGGGEAEEMRTAHPHGASQTRTATVRHAHDDSGDGFVNDACYTQNGDVYTLTNCEWQGDGWTEYFNGTETFNETDQNDWNDSYNLMVVSSDGQGDAESDALNGTEAATQASNVYTYAENDTDAYTGAYQGDLYSGNYSDDLTWVFTASASDPNSGTETVAGTWAETFTDSTGTQDVSTVVSTPTALTIDSSCDSGVTAGEILAVSGASSVSMTWNGCDQETVVYSGPQSGS
jgi:hypothetical protein